MILSVARARRAVILAFATVALAAPLLPQAIPLDLEVGYRWVDVSGNERMYSE